MPTREPPPGLVVQYPKCPMCWAETRLDDDVFTCESCGASWSLSNPEAPGEWDDPDAAPCESTPCLLAADHPPPHRDTYGRAVF